MKNSVNSTKAFIVKVTLSLLRRNYMKILNESVAIPKEGYFWIINNKVIGIAEDVPKYNYEYHLTNKTHENTWPSLRDDYKVNDKVVSFNYFPRGRVMVDPNYDNDNNFTNYSVLIMADPCILNNDKYKDLVLDYYNLNLPSCQKPMWPRLNERAGINHYSCNNCR